MREFNFIHTHKNYLEYKYDNVIKELKGSKVNASEANYVLIISCTAAGHKFNSFWDKKQAKTTKTKLHS